MYLGINAFSHDASAAIVDDEGRIIAAAQEERFTHNKRESRFPVESIRYCLKEAGVGINELGGIGFAWDPDLMITQRVIGASLFHLPFSLAAIRQSLGQIKEIRSVPALLQKDFAFDASMVPFRYLRHHACHAANAYYASPFEHAAFLTIDGGGELEAITWGTAEGGKIKKLGQGYLPHSIGRVYSATCRFLGFWGAEKEGTAMALAAFGAPKYLDIYRKIIRPVKEKGLLNVKVDARYLSSHEVTNTAMFSDTFRKTFGIPPRKGDDPITEVHKDIAASVQKRTEEVIVELLDRLYAITKEPALVLSGGVALNSVLNGKLEKISPFKEVFIQPAASDTGLSLGAAYLLRQEKHGGKPPAMESAALGPAFTDAECKTALDKAGLGYETPGDLARATAAMIAEGKAVAWFQGRMEFGPRALGQRSLLGDARSAGMLDKLNLVKKREKFRPFAISILKEKALDVLENIDDSPFMLMVDTVRPGWKSRIPSAQHVDGSVRVQTVCKGRDGLYYDLIKEFDALTGVPLIINTSLNIKGQPIVCTPEEAIETFISSEIDALVMGPYIVKK